MTAYLKKWGDPQNAATLAVLCAAILSGCATRMETATWVGREDGDPVKLTRVTHAWNLFGLGLPCFAPGDFSVTDGEFKVTSKAVELPDIGTIWKQDED